MVDFLQVDKKSPKYRFRSIDEDEGSVFADSDDSDDENLWDRQCAKPSLNHSYLSTFTEKSQRHWSDFGQFCRGLSSSDQ